MKRLSLQPTAVLVAVVAAMLLGAAGALIANAVRDTASTNACASFVPNRDVLGDSARSAAEARDQATMIVRCRTVLGRTEQEISALLGVNAADPSDVGSPGDQYRIWSFAGDAGLEVNFADDGHASLARALPVDGAD